MKDSRLDTILIVRLPAWARKKLEKIARRNGLGASTLARMWLLEKLQTVK